MIGYANMQKASMISAIKQSANSLVSRFVETVRNAPVQVLPPFYQQRSPLSRMFLNAVFLTFCAFLGLFYGFWGTLLPPAFIIFLAVPILILLLVVAWVLPDTDIATSAALPKLLMVFTAVVFAWPNYLALVLPGLPWLSFRRLVGIALVVAFIYILASRSGVRRQIVEALNAHPVIWKLMVSFVAIQTIAIFFGDNVIGAYKIWFTDQYSWTTVFFVSVFVFLQPGSLERWAKLICFVALFCSAIGLLEQHNQQVLWAQHIPSFLQVDDETLADIITPNFRQGEYRSLSTFGHPLLYAEFLALVSVLMTHVIMTTQDVRRRILAILGQALIISGIFVARARLGFVGFIDGHIVYGLIWGIRQWRNSKSGLLGPALTLSYPALMAAAGILILSVDALRFRIIGNSTTQASNDGRAEQFAMAPEAWLHSPIFGNGPAQSARVLGYATPSGKLTIDTYVVSILLDYGIVGFFVYLGLILSVLYIAIKTAFGLKNFPSKEMEEIGYIFPLGVMLVVFLVIKYVLSSEDNNTILFMIMGAIVALKYRHQQMLLKSVNSSAVAGGSR